MRARSGLRNSVQASGSCPPGRNASVVSGSCRNRASLSAVCWRKVSSTTKPCRASRVAGCSASASESVPNSSSARSQVRGVPGVPTDSPLVRTDSNGSGAPVASVRERAVIESGAVSRPSMLVTSPLSAS